MEAGYGCSEECGCEHCHRIQVAYDEREALLERIRGDAIRLIAAYDAQAARLAAAERFHDLGAHTAACQAGLGYGGCEATCARLRAIISIADDQDVGYSCSEECGCEHCHRIQVAYDAQAARLAAQQPVIDAVLKLSTYSRETVDDGVRRIVQASDEYEEWLLGHHGEEPCARS